MKTENRNSTGSTGMSLARFAALAGAYGADFDRWPEAERFPAISLAGRSEEARALLADAHELDSILARLDPPPPPSAAVRGRVAALTPGDAPPRLAGVAALVGRGTAFAMAAAAGLAIGVFLAPPGTGDPAGLGLVEASLIAGEAPSIVVGELLELD